MEYVQYLNFKNIVCILFFLLGSSFSYGEFAAGAEQKKVLYIASYQMGEDWSFGIKTGIESVLSRRKDVQLKIASMDTKRNPSEKFKKSAALEMKALIESWQPDVVIASDDNASKYLIVPYYKDSDLPFVFCGVNWSVSEYGFPFKNVTGMIEVQLVDQLVNYLSPYTKNAKIGSLRANTMTNVNEASFVETYLNTKIDTRFVEEIDQWKKQFILLQQESGMVLLGDMSAIDLQGETVEDLEEFILMNTIIPTGQWNAWHKNEALITIATIPEEQGEYSAKVALEILGGKTPDEIPIVKNKKATLYLNMKIAKKLGIIFPFELIERAHLVSDT